jgi:hypothetical protein
MGDRDAASTGVRSYLACAEPTWAEAVSELQLTGLLNLTALLSPTAYLTDVHLGDNVHFFRSFASGKTSGLFAQLRGLTEAGIVHLLLRDRSVRPNLHDARKEIACGSFGDVYRSWLTQDPRAAWIYQDISEAREKYFADLDSWARGQSVERYDYVAVKLLFMQKLRDSLKSGASPWLTRAIGTMPSAIVPDYHDIMNRDWFTLSDLYSLFQRAGIEASDRLMIYHGLMNELAYCSATDASIVGVDRDGTPIEAEVWDKNQQLKTVSVAELLERGHAVLDAPSLAVLGVISPSEIVELRKYGQGYFDLLRLSQDAAFASADLSQFGRRFVFAAVDYWRTICDRFAAAHPTLAKRQTKLAFFLGSLPLIGEWAQSAVSVGVDIGRAAVAASNPLAGIVADAASPQIKRVSLRMLFLADSAEFRRIQSVIPNRAWFKRSEPSLKTE